MPKWIVLECETVEFEEIFDKMGENVRYTFKSMTDATGHKIVIDPRIARILSKQLEWLGWLTSFIHSWSVGTMYHIVSDLMVFTIAYYRCETISSGKFKKIKQKTNSEYIYGIFRWQISTRLK